MKKDYLHPELLVCDIDAQQVLCMSMTTFKLAEDFTLVETDYEGF